MILALDPGTHKTGLVLLDGNKILRRGHEANAAIMREIVQNQEGPDAWIVAVEHLLSHGKQRYENKNIMVTVEWAARFYQAGGGDDAAVWVTRDEELRHYGIMPGTRGNRDMLLRRAIVERYRFEHRVTKAGSLIVPGWADHTLAALAVGVVAADKIRFRERMVDYDTRRTG